MLPDRPFLIRLYVSFAIWQYYESMSTGFVFTLEDIFSAMPYAGEAFPWKKLEFLGFTTYSLILILKRYKK